MPVRLSLVPRISRVHGRWPAPSTRGSRGAGPALTNKNREKLRPEILKTSTALGTGALFDMRLPWDGRSYSAGATDFSPEDAAPGQTGLLSPDSTKKKILLIDAYPMLYRAYYSIPALGQKPLNAVYGFLVSFLKIVRETEFQSMAVCLEGGNNFRKKLDSNYKSKRAQTPDALFHQLPILEEALAAFGVPFYKADTFEADDLIVTFARMFEQRGYQVLIISPDKDLLQAVTPNVFVKTLSNREQTIDVKKVLERFSVEPWQIPHLQAIIGDPVDSIPKVSGISESAAVKLIQEFGTINRLFDNIDQVSSVAVRDNLRLNVTCIKRSLALSTLRSDVPDLLHVSTDSLKFEKVAFGSALSFCTKYGLRSIVRILERMRGGSKELAGSEKRVKGARRESAKRLEFAVPSAGEGGTPLTSGRSRLLKTIARRSSSESASVEDAQRTATECGQEGPAEGAKLNADKAVRGGAAGPFSVRSVEVDIDTDPLVAELTKSYCEAKVPLEEGETEKVFEEAGVATSAGEKEEERSGGVKEANNGCNKRASRRKSKAAEPKAEDSTKSQAGTSSPSCERKPAERSGFRPERRREDVEEEDEESNLELVDFIKNRKAIEIDPEFVNLFRLCRTSADRRRVLEKKIQGVTVVNDAESSRAVLSKLYELKDRYHACDTETIDLDLKKQSPVGHGRVICVSIYCGPDVDFGNGPRIWLDNLYDSTTLESFKEYFESPSIRKIWHNYGFDRHVLMNHGIDCQGFYGDTMHMARLWDASRRGAKAYSLEVLSQHLLVGENEAQSKISMKQRFGRVKLKKDGTPSKSAIVLPALDELQNDAEWLPEWIDYSTLDAEDTWRLREVLQSKLMEMAWTSEDTMWEFYQTIWLPFGELLTSMERRGIKVDSEYLRELIPRAQEEKQACTKKFVEWCMTVGGEECRWMNPGSDAQKQQLLFAPCVNRLDPNKTMPEERVFETENVDGYVEDGKKKPKKKRSFTIRGLGLPYVETTESGWPAVSYPVLNRLSGEPPATYGPLRQMMRDKQLDGEAACEALAAAVEASKIDTLISTFMVPLGTFADAHGRVHGSLNINTETGRLSSRRPNLQNQPAHDKDRFKIRKAFTCEEGNMLIVADYGQLELRLLAHMANCSAMISAFKQGGDFHSRTAFGMYPHIRKAVERGEVLLEWDMKDGKPPLPLIKDAYAVERRRAKTLNFSIAYGKTVQGLAKDWDVPLFEARETLERWYSDRPEVLEWQQKTIAEAHKTGWTRTLLGRYRFLPDINSRIRTKRMHSERAAINTPLQGGAADITTRAMVSLEKNQRLRELKWVQLLQIHDELIFEGPEFTAEEALQIIVDIMGHPLPMELLVDLAVDAKIAKTWFDAK
ncbi:uncharacterized protein LOC126318245 [Schistocerca gregaria]|uniref:uncharacterized protein LOC126318245 n=1 Tax=Schistocerca gregaria TaxID=7010 RepID=UPI00211EEEA7|nr:uncharacterized protein LOC126318245 [Schistocerca gregaria]